jgi:hypothetical protein
MRHAKRQSKAPKRRSPRLIRERLGILFKSVVGTEPVEKRPHKAGLPAGAAAKLRRSSPDCRWGAGQPLYWAILEAAAIAWVVGETERRCPSLERGTPDGATGKAGKDTPLFAAMENVA